MALVPLTPSQDDIECGRLESELAVLLDEVSAREADFVAIGRDLASFRLSWAQRFGPLYAELDRLDAHIARRLASINGTDAARRRATEAAEHARRSERLAGDAQAAPPEREPREAPSAEAKAMYRRAARALHPDLALDEPERLRRTRSMAALNSAYADGDVATMTRILNDEAAERPGSAHRQEESRRSRLERQVTQMRSRLAELDSLLADLYADPMFALSEREQRAPRGMDPFAADEADIRVRIASADAQLRAIAGVA